MTMQQALFKALQSNLHARPVGSRNYTYQYVSQGRELLIRICGRDGRGVLRSGYWRTLTKREIEDEWVVCDCDGAVEDPAVPKGLSLADLVA